MKIRELLDHVCNVDTLSIGIEKDELPIYLKPMPIGNSDFLNEKILSCDKIELFIIENNNLCIMLDKEVDINELKV